MITLILNEEEFKLLESDLIELNGRRGREPQPKGYDYNSQGLRLIRNRAVIEMPLGQYRGLVETLVDRSM